MDAKMSDLALTVPHDTPLPSLFLTSTIQMLWQTDAFRKDFRAVKKHKNCKYNACSFCALKSIYTNFQHHKYTGLPPNIVQRAASILQSGWQTSFDSAAHSLSSILTSLDQCLSTPLGNALFGLQIRETITCECGYRQNSNPQLKLYLSFSVKRLCSLFHSIPDSAQFSKYVQQAILSHDTFPCPNHTKCSRSVRPTLEVLTSPPILAVEVQWDAEDGLSEDLSLFLDSMTIGLTSDELRMTGFTESKREYFLSAMVCLLERREVCFTYHSSQHLWVRTDSDSVKLADGTFSQLLGYIRQNRYLPTLLLFSDPLALTATEPAPAAVSLADPVPSLTSGENCHQLSHVWEDEQHNTSLWSSDFPEHLPSQNNFGLPTDDSCSYGYLDFGLGSKEPHGGRINLSSDISLSPHSDSLLDPFQSIQVFVHSPSTHRHNESSDRELLPPSPDRSISSFPPPQLREHTQRSSSQKHVPSIPTPFALLWQLQVFRRSLQSVKGHVCTLKTCVFCVYQHILERFDYKDIPIVPPELLRRAMALCFEKEKGYNLALSFDDVPKTYEELLTRVHYNLTGIQDMTSCTAPHCLTHRKFAARFSLSGECTCGHRLDPSTSLDLVYSVSAQSLIEETRQLAGKLSSTQLEKKGFGHILRDIGALNDTQPCPNPACKLPLRIQRSLDNKPDVFTISLNWDGLPLTTQNLDDVINSIGVSLRLTDVFPPNDSLLRFRPFYLTAIVARHDPRYAFFFHHSTLHAWYCMDDVRITTLGDKWPGVLNTLHTLPYQAILLVYTDPLFSPLETSTALTESVVSPGAEGEKIRRESLFPSVSDNCPVHRNRHGSPESMYSSDAELFQWRAGERLSSNSELLKPEVLSNESLPLSDSEQELNEDMGTFRVNEGSDGGGKTLFDIITLSPETSNACETPALIPPSLWVLWQLDVFRRGLSGVGEHRCEGSLCLLCAFIQSQQSKDFSFSSELLTPILSLSQQQDQHTYPSNSVTSTYQHVLTRLHNALCTDGQEMGLSVPIREVRCESEACIPHQRLVTHLEVTPRGEDASQHTRMVLEVSARQLIQKIRDLNASTSSRLAGSIRVMRLFSQAARDLLEQPEGVKSHHISLLNSPDVISFSLRWSEEPDRDEVAEFYELISTAIQPQDLFHYTHNKHISKRMYYLQGIVTQSHSSHETWFYNHEVCSWTHYSGRTRAVNVLGPQLSLVWHSCRSSASTHTPVFLLYSNPSISPSVPTALPVCTQSAHYNAIPPSQHISNEDYVIVPNQVSLTDHFSVQNGVDEALSFLDATLRHEEMLLTPSPPPPPPLNYEFPPPDSVRRSNSFDRSASLGSDDYSLISDNNVQVSSQSQLTSPLSDCPLNSILFTPQLSKLTEYNCPPNISPQSLPAATEMDYAERLSVMLFTLLQMNHFRLSLLQIHDQIIEDTPLISLKQIFHIVIAVPHLIPSKFIPVSCQHLGLLSQLTGSTSADFYIDFITQLFSRFPVNPFVNYIKQSMQLMLQHREGTLYTQVVLPVSANRLVADLNSSLAVDNRAIPSPKLFSSLIRRLLTYDGSSLALMNSPDVIPVHLQWNPDVINSPDTEFLVQHICPSLLLKELFPLVANKFIAQRVLYLYGLIVSLNQVQLVIYYTTDIQSWIIYDGTHFEKIGLVWQDVRYFLESNCCRPDILFYLNPTPALLDPSHLERGLPEISHTKTNPSLNTVAEQILTELFPRQEADPHSLVQDVVKPLELQQMARSPVKIVLSNSNAASIEELNLTANAGSLEGLDIVSIGSNYESSLHRRKPSRNGLVHGQKLPLSLLTGPSRSSSDTSTFRKETRASYHPFFTTLVALWSIDLFRESLLRLEMQLRTPDTQPLVTRLKEMFSATSHATSLTPPLDLFQSLSSRLLKSPHFAGSGSEVFNTVLLLLRDELKKSISFQGPDPIEQSRLIQNIFSLTLQQSGKCRCGAIYEPNAFNQNLLHLNLASYLPHAQKTCNKYGNINNVPRLAHRAIRDTLLLMNKLDCKSQTCHRAYIATSLLVTAPRVLCVALDSGDDCRHVQTLLTALPTSLQIDKLFKEIGPLAKASTLLYLTGLMAELSQDRLLHMYYHTGLQTWVSVDGMGYKELGSWGRVVEEIDALNAKPSTLFYTNPLDFSHQYQDSALLFPVSSIKRAMSAPAPRSPEVRPHLLSSSSATPDPQYVPIHDINLKKKMNVKQTDRNKHVSQHSASSSSEDMGSHEEKDEERPPLPVRISHSKESLEGLERTLIKPAPVGGSSHYSSVSELSALAGMSSGKSSGKSAVRSTTDLSRTAPVKPTQQNGGKTKNKHKKATSITLLNKLNPKTYFKKKDKVRIPQVEQTTREYPPSDLDTTSPRLSELIETPNLKHDKLTRSDENYKYNEHLDQLFSSDVMPVNMTHSERTPNSKRQKPPAPSFLTPKTYTAENLGRYDQVVREFKGNTPPKLQEDSPLSHPMNAEPVPRPRVHRSQRDPFESSIAAHILLQMINFPAYYHSVQNFGRMKMKKKHQIIKALDALFARASSHPISQLDIIEYLNTCMPSMLGSVDFDTGHRLFHQLHWSFHPHSDAFKERFSLQVSDTARAGGVKDVYFVVTTVSQWLTVFEKPLQHNTPVTYNHKVLREGLRGIFPSLCPRICNCPDQFYVAVDYDRELDTVSTWRIWNCIPTLLTLRDLTLSLDAKHSLDKPYYLTGVITKNENGSLSSYCYLESRGMWCCYSSTAASHSNMQHWDELLAQVIAHSIYPFALLYTSSHSQPLFSRLPITSRQAPSLPFISPAPQIAAPPLPVHNTSESLASSLDRVRYHTLTPHPSVPSVPSLDASHNLTAQLLSTLLLTPGFTSSFPTPDPSTRPLPIISEVRNLIASSLHSFSSRQLPILVFVERNLGEGTQHNNPSDHFNQLISRLAEGEPTLSHRLNLSVESRNGEECLSSVSLSLSVYRSQAANIPQFSKLNPKHCRIALKSVSSLKNKRIQNCSRLVTLCCSQEMVSRDILTHLPPQLQLSYLGAISSKKFLSHLSYYLTGLLMCSEGVETVYTSAVYLCPREKWLLFRTGSLSEGEEMSWPQLCDRISSSQFSPLFCFYSNSNIMGHYSASFAGPPVPPLSSCSLTSPETPTVINRSPSILQPGNRHSHMLELRIGNTTDLHTDYLAPTTSLTDTNPPPDLFQELFSLDRASSPFITFPPPPPDTSPSPPSIMYLTPEFHTHSFHTPHAATTMGQLLTPPLEHTRSQEQATPPLLVSALTMLWHLSFFRQAVLLSPGHTCLGFSCPLCVLKSLFALHYYSRSYALPHDALSLAHTHAFTSTHMCRSIGELIPAIARLTDETLQTGRYRSLMNFTMEHEQGSLNAFHVSLNALNQNIMALARTNRFRSESHPLVFSKALGRTLQANLKIRSIPHVLILDFNRDASLTSPGVLGTYIQLSDLVPVRKDFLSPHYYLSSILATDQSGKCVTFSYHVELCHWVGYDGYVVQQFTNIHQLAEHLISQRFSLLSSLYLNPATPKPSPHELPQENTRARDASGDSATIRRMQQVEAESGENKASLYPPLPPAIGFDRLLEDYEREKQGVGRLTIIPQPDPIQPPATLTDHTFQAVLALPPPIFSSDPASQPAVHCPSLLTPVPSLDPTYPSNNLSHPLLVPPSITPSVPAIHSAHHHHPNLTPVPSTEPQHPGTEMAHPLFTPPINLAYPPLYPAAEPSQQHMYPPRQYPPPPKFSFSTPPQADRRLSSAAVGLLARKLTESGVWKKLFQSIPCIGESYEVKAFEQRQKQTQFNPGRAVLERIQNYQVPMEIVIESFMQLQFQEGISILTDPSSYSTSPPPPDTDLLIDSSPSRPPEQPSLLASDGSSTSSEEEYDPDPSSINTEPLPDPEDSAVSALPPAEPPESTEMTDSEQLDEESELLLRRHSEEEASLLLDYQEKMHEQEARQQREVDSLRDKQLQSIAEFREEISCITNGQTEGLTQDVPQYVHPPQLSQDTPGIGIPAFPASFPPTKADMFYTQARDLYRESHNVSDFSVAFSLCVQAQNKLDLALIEPDVRLDPVKKQAFSQLRQICHQQAVKLHRRSVLRTLDPNHQFKSPPKKQPHLKAKRVKFDPTLGSSPSQEEAVPPPPPETETHPSYSRPILRPPPLTPSLYQSIPRPPPIGRAIQEEEKENKLPVKSEHKMNYPPSRTSLPVPPPPTDTPSISDSHTSTPSTTPSLPSTLSDDQTSSSSSRASTRSHRHYPPSRPFFNEDHYTLLDKFIKCKREEPPSGTLDHSELSRKLLDSKIHSRSLSVSTSSSNASPAPGEPTQKRDYFKISPDEEGALVPRITTQGTPLVSEKCSVCRSSKFFTIKGMCPECYTRHVRSTDLMMRSGVHPTDV